MDSSKSLLWCYHPMGAAYFSISLQCSYYSVHSFFFITDLQNLFLFWVCCNCLYCCDVQYVEKPTKFQLLLVAGPLVNETDWSFILNPLIGSSSQTHVLLQLYLMLWWRFQSFKRYQICQNTIWGNIYEVKHKTSRLFIMSFSFEYFSTYCCFLAQ